MRDETWQYRVLYFPLDDVLVQSFLLNQVNFVLYKGGPLVICELLHWFHASDTLLTGHSGSPPFE